MHVRLSEIADKKWAPPGSEPYDPSRSLTLSQARRVQGVHLGLDPNFDALEMGREVCATACSASTRRSPV